MLCASETGTAKELGARIADWLRLCDVSVTFGDLDLIWSTRRAIIVCSTTGDGEAPLSMRATWHKLLMKECGRMEGFEYALYGLGDARYGVKFNAAARRLDARLRQLGAEPLVDRVLADACAHGGHVAPLSDFYKRLSSTLGIPNRPELPESREDLPAIVARGAAEEENYEIGAIESNQRLTSEEWEQDVRNIRIGGKFRYAPGDVCHVRHRNHPSLIRRATKKFGRLERLELMDLSRPPNQLTLGRLGLFATDEEQASKLKELASPQGLGLFDEYVSEERRSLLDVLDDFDSVALPSERFLAELVPLQPRAFSIASAPTTRGRLNEETESEAVELCVAVVEIATPLGRKMKGACSSWLASLVPDDRVEIRITKGSFFTKSNGNDRSPLVLVGPGTGVAPMRAIAQRCLEQEQNVYTLFFGCRHPDHDHLYASLPNQVVAYSRHPDKTQRAYVTRRLEERRDELASVLLDDDKKDGAIFVAGNLRMATDVRNLMVSIIERHQGCSNKRAQQIMLILEKRGKFAVEAYN